MSDFDIWFITGFQHILDLEGYDHILFVTLLAVSFPAQEWKKLLGLVTAFTLGHSLTLALSVLNVIRVSQIYIELLITLTILTTAINLFFSSKNHPKRVMHIYLIICCFGLIHGMGFSYLLKSMLSSGDNIIWPLFLFNTGIEAGQIIIVSFVLLISFLLIRYLKTPFHLIQKTVAVISIIFAATMSFQRLIAIFS